MNNKQSHLFAALGRDTAEHCLADLRKLFQDEAILFGYVPAGIKKDAHCLRNIRRMVRYYAIGTRPLTRVSHSNYAVLP